jgi:hypothetical protein
MAEIRNAMRPKPLARSGKIARKLKLGDWNAIHLIAPYYHIFYDSDDYFRVKNIPDKNESRLMLHDLGLELYNQGTS